MTENPLYARNEADENDKGEIYDSRVLTKLIRNYRSHPAILKLPNEMFYDNELQVHANEAVRNELCRWENLPKKVSADVLVTISHYDRICMKTLQSSKGL